MIGEQATAKPSDAATITVRKRTPVVITAMPHPLLWRPAPFIDHYIKRPTMFKNGTAFDCYRHPNPEALRPRNSPIGQKDWALTAKLGATVVQDCVVTLEPVTTRIDEDVHRQYIADFVVSDAAEVEMDEDDTIEELPSTLDLVAVMIEALSLALPAFPRAPDASLDDAQFTEPGQAPMTDEDAKPFAGLGALRDALEKKGN